MIRIIVITSLLSLFCSFSFGKDTVKKKPRYKSGKRIDFESLLIEGEKKKADYSVVTGNLGEKNLGLLKLRDNFIDQIQNDAMEEVQ